MAKKKKNKYTVNILWKDRRRRLGMPLSFQRYRLGEDRLFYEKGFLSTTVDDILLYRVRDISVKISFWQRLTGVGTVTVNSSDQTMCLLCAILSVPVRLKTCFINRSKKRKSPIASAIMK